VRLEGLGQLKKILLIGTRARDLPACSIVPQPTTLPRAPTYLQAKEKSIEVGEIFLMPYKIGIFPYFSHVYMILKASLHDPVSVTYRISTRIICFVLYCLK
jgi:hypothetical protein